MNSHVKDDVGDWVTDDNHSAPYWRNSEADDSPTIEMSSALEESIDYERILFASCVLKCESLKGIDRFAIKSNNTGGGGLYTFDDDREDEESANRVANVVAVDDENTHATDKVVIPPAMDLFKEEKEDYDDSYESLLQRAKQILKLIRIAQHQERMQQLQQQHYQEEGKPSLTLLSPLPDNTVETSMRESAPQLHPKLERERMQQQPQYQQREEKAAAKEQQQQQLHASTSEPSPPTKSQPVDAVAASTLAPTPLHEDQRTAMDTFLSSPTALNWNELVQSMRQQRHAGESGKPRYNRRRHNPMNIQTITVHKQLDQLDDDDNSSLTLSSSSRSPNEPSQSQQPLQDNQRTAMESFLSSPTGLNWDDLVKSLRKERGGEYRSRQAGRPSAGGRFNIRSITIYSREEEGDYDDMSSLGMQSRDESNNHRHRKLRQQRKQEQQGLQDGSRTAKNEEEIMHNATVDVKSSSPSKRVSQRELQQHNQSSLIQDRRRRSKKDIDKASRGKDKRSLERRIERVLALNSTATNTDADATYTASANVGGEMILNDLKNIDEGITLTPKTIATVSTATSTTTRHDRLARERTVTAPSPRNLF